ncbi:MAG: NAD(P)/FAD-dependent oxidoreductase [Steroidobacteraceae bacterium]
MTASWDCIIVGGGHNGLVCAAYLARAGRSVLVLEARSTVGGAAVTREFAPGFKVSAGAHHLGQFPREIITALQLERHGLKFAGRALPTVALAGGGSPLSLDEPGLRAAGNPDAQALPAFLAQMHRFAAVLYGVLDAPPPRLGTGALKDTLSLLRLGWRLRRLGRRDMRELLRIGGMNAYDLLQEHFRSDAVQGAFALDSTLGSNAGPRTPGTVLTLLYRLACEGAAGRDSRLVLGGLGGLADALANAARAAGATVRVDSPVAGILVEQDRAVGVRLADGEELRARTIISNADPKTTSLDLLGARHLDTGFVRSIRHLRNRGLAAKLHLALDAEPVFAGLARDLLGARLLVAPSMDAVELAYNHSKYGEFSEAPVLEISVPSAADPGLAPAGRHVLSAVVQYAPHGLRGGWTAGARQVFTDRIIATLERVAPGIRGLVRSAQLLVPEDIEREFGIRGGHWHHAEFAFDQFFMVRPVPGAAQYATPLAGLRLCGAGSHPGGGVTGLPGRNAARRLLEEGAGR